MTTRTLPLLSCSFVALCAAAPASAASSGFGTFVTTSNLAVEESEGGLIIEADFYDPTTQGHYAFGVLGGGRATVALVDEHGLPEALFSGVPHRAGPHFVELGEPEVSTPGGEVLSAQLLAVQLDAHGSEAFADETPVFLMLVGESGQGSFAASVGFAGAWASDGGSSGLWGTDAEAFDVPLVGLFGGGEGVMYAPGVAFDEPVLFVVDPDRGAFEGASEALAVEPILGGDALAVREQWQVNGVLGASVLGVWGTDGNIIVDPDSLEGVWGTDGNIIVNDDLWGVASFLPEVDDELYGCDGPCALLRGVAGRGGAQGGAEPTFLGATEVVADAMFATLAIWGSQSAGLAADAEAAAWVDFAVAQLGEHGPVEAATSFDGLTVIPLAEVSGLALTK